MRDESKRSRKKGVALLIIVFMLSNAPYAKEAKNTHGAVKNAKHGDCIMLKGSCRYVLAEEEITIANRDFDYSNGAEH